MKVQTAIVLLFVLLYSVTIFGQSSAARDSVNRGIQAIQTGRYQEAVENFKKAVELDPELTIAELHLATAYRQQFMPFNTSPENLKVADLSIQSYEKYLKTDPKNMDALAGIAGMYQNTSRYDKAREAYIRCTEVAPRNHLPFYAVGTMDWLLVHDSGTRLPLEDKTKFIDEGMRYLDKALALSPDYEDAFWYQNLLLREKIILLEGKIDATTDKPTRNALLAETEVLNAKANEWVNNALELRKKNTARRK